MGTYTDIVNIIMPSMAAPGEAVTVEVQVKNINPAGAVLVTVTGKLITGGVVDGTPVYFGSLGYYLPYGVTQSFYESFIMPAANVDVYVWTWVKIGGNWVQDDSGSLRIVVKGALPGVPAGDIILVKLRMGWGEYNLPVAGVQLDDTFKLIVKVKNTSSVTFVPHLYYRIARPNEPNIERVVYPIGSLGPGKEHTFYEDPVGTPTYFVVTSSGTWSLYLELRDVNGNVLDTYQANMFTIAVKEPPNGEPVEGVGKITEVTIIHGTNTFGNEYTPPVTNVKTGDWFKIKVSGTNRASGNVKLGLHYIITKPSGATIERTVHELDWTGPGGSTTFIEGPAGLEDAFNIDQLGDWSLYLEWLGLNDQIGDTWQGNILVGVVQAPATLNIFELIPAMIAMMMLSVMMPFIEQPEKILPAVGKGAKAAGEVVVKIIK